MEIKEIQKDIKPEKRNVSLSFRITKTQSKFMKDNKISPTKLFIKSLEELMKEQSK